MPFIERTVKPYNLIKQSKNNVVLFQTFDEVSNYTLTGAMRQLASLCHQAEDIFGGLSNECYKVNRRCKMASLRLKNLQSRIDVMDAKTVAIPVSDLDVERGIPVYLHYQAPNSLEEDLFTNDSRIPCVIHLHQKASHDLSHLLRGTDAYAKPLRPKSLDPRLLMDESYSSGPYSPRSPRNSSFISASGHISNKVRKDHNVSLPTSDQKMRLDSSLSNIDIIKVDTSGAKFERQANLRRSQRLSSCSNVRQRANASQRRQLRHKHKTLVGLPGNISSELGDGCIIRPYSLHSDINNSSGFRTEGGSSDESQYMINGHVAVSPNQRNAEIQTDDVKVLPLTPSQRRMRQKGIKSNHASPTSSHGSTEFIDSPTAVPCPTVPNMKQQTSTPINGVHERDMIRPSSLDVVNNDTSTDEGRHTGESNPPTPVRNGTPQELSASPHLKPSPSSTMPENTNVKPNDIAFRMNGDRLQQQGEDRASSGFWSGTESTQHSSSSDITAQHAQVTKTLQKIAKHDRRSPILSNSVGKKSPLVDNRAWMATSSAISSSTVSINSKLSTMDMTTSYASLADDDERFQSTNSSVISVTLSRSHNNSTLSLNSDGGTGISAAAMLKKARKGRKNAPSGSYNFMNYEVDTLDDTDETSRVVKNRRLARSVKHRGGSKRLLTPDDTISMSSMLDYSPQYTDVDGHSVHSASRLTNDTTSLCESMFSVDQEGYYTSMHDDCGIPKSISPCGQSVKSIADSVTSDSTLPASVAVTPIVQKTVEVKITSPEKEKQQAFFGEEFKHAIEARNNSNYNSYNRAVNSNHSTPKSLLSPRGKSQSMKTPKVVQPPALDFQSELNKRLSLRKPSDKTSPINKKDKRRPPPPPPRRASSLSSSASPSPVLSRKLTNEKGISPLVSNSYSPAPFTPLSPEVFYMQTLPPPPPTEELPLPPPPEELLYYSPKTEGDKLIKSSPAPTIKPPSPPKPMRTSSQRSKSPSTKSPQRQVVQDVVTNSPSSPTEDSQKSPQSSPTSPQGQPYFSIAMQAAALGNRFTEKKKPSNEIKTEKDKITTKPKTEIVNTSPAEKKQITVSSVKSREVSPVKLFTATKPVVKTPPPTAPKTTSKVPPVVSPKPTESFDNKRTREQSPSYRASMARAAFFSTVAPPEPPKSENPSVGHKNVTETDNCSNMEPQVAPVVKSETPTKDEIVAETKEKVQNINAKQDTVKIEQINDKTTVKSEEKIVREDTTEETQKTEEPEDAQENTDWLGQIDEFSTPNYESKSPLVDKSDSTAPKVAPKPSSKFSSHNKLMEAIHKTKREALSGKSTSSPPSSPGVNGESFNYKTSTSNGNKSPASTLERKRNGRLSTNGQIKNGISRKSTGGTSRDNFKALLLQNACRGTNGSQMTAMEKLQLNKPAAATAKTSITRQRPYSTSDLLSEKSSEEQKPLDDAEETENTRPILSLSDIRSAITSGSPSTRQGRPSTRKGTTMEPGAKHYATLSSIYKKKHPPPSMSSKYNTRSRTPTRPMMSITEDSETEKCPEQLLQRAAEI